jgi:hypothetical protein
MAEEQKIIDDPFDITKGHELIDCDRQELYKDLYFERIVDSLYSELSDILKSKFNNIINEKNLFHIVAYVMQLVEKESTVFTGKGKKELVIVLFFKDDRCGHVHSLQSK